MLSIRLSDDQYREIKDRCREAGGGLTISGFVRAAMLEALGSSSVMISPVLEMRMGHIHRRLERLEAWIEERGGTPNL